MAFKTKLSINMRVAVIKGKFAYIDFMIGGQANLSHRVTKGNLKITILCDVVSIKQNEEVNKGYEKKHFFGRFFLSKSPYSCFGSQYPHSF